MARRKKTKKRSSSRGRCLKWGRQRGRKVCRRRAKSRARPKSRARTRTRSGSRGTSKRSVYGKKRGYTLRVREGDAGGRRGGGYLKIPPRKCLQWEEYKGERYCAKWSKRAWPRDAQGRSLDPRSVKQRALRASWRKDREVEDRKWRAKGKNPRAERRREWLELQASRINHIAKWAD